jgi:hypothetical protein
MTPKHQQLLALALLAGMPLSASAADSVTLASPDQRVSAKVSIQNKELVYQLSLAGKTVLEDARLGVTVDGADLGSGINDLKAGAITEHKDSYHLNGDESLLNSHDKRITITAERDGEPLVIELRAFDGGLGFRYIIPGSAPRKISGEATFVLPVVGKNDAFILMSDRWKPENAIDGRYLWLPIQFNGNGKPFLVWKDKWDLSVFGGD